MTGRMDRPPLDSIYVLKKAINQFLKNTLASLQRNFGSTDRRHHLSVICQKLSSSSSHFLKESEIQVALNELALQLIIEKAESLLDSLLECILLEVEHLFSSLLKQRLESSLDIDKRIDCLGSIDLPMDSVDLDDIDGLDEIILNKQIGDPRLRQFLIFGFCAQVFHPVWTHPQRIQLYSDIHFRFLYWKAISQKQHVDDCLMIDRIQRISLGHSTTIWTKISNRE